MSQREIKEIKSFWVEERRAQGNGCTGERSEADVRQWMNSSWYEMGVTETVDDWM